MSPTTGAAKSIRRHAAARRARAELLLGLSAFVLLSAGVTVLLNCWLPQVIDPDYYSRLQYLRRGRAADPAHTRTVLMFGSSRTYEGLDAIRLERTLSEGLGRPASVVNFGIPGRCFLGDLLTWRRLRRDGVRPDLLLIEVMPGLFHGDEPAQLAEEAMPATRLCWFDLTVLDRYRAGFRPEVWRDVALADVSPLYSRRFAIARAVAPNQTPPLDEHHLPLAWDVNLPFLPCVPSPEERVKALAHARQEYAEALVDFRPGRCEALRELLGSCREAGVAAALVVMPEGPVYRSWYGPRTWPRVQAWLDDIHREYGVPVINAREWIGDEQDFKDSHHLLTSGAAKFTDRLGREYLLPLLRRLPEPRPETPWSPLLFGTGE